MSVQTGWRQVILRDLCESVRYGYTAKAQDEPVGPKFLRITDIVPDLIAWDSVPHCEISPENVEKYKLQEGDIVIARTGATTGYAKWVKSPQNAVFASYLVRLRIAKEHDSRYIGFIVESKAYKQFIMANVGGAAQPNANAQILTSFPVLLPPLPTQRKIAAVLSAYGDLIENNTRRIAVLEEMARLLYREWFVHFRFPGHEDVAMIDSELGPIPEGWEVKKVTNAVEVNPRMKVPKGGEKPHVPMKSLSETSMLIRDIKSKEGNSGSKFRNNDTLFARITPCLENGKTGFVQFLESDDDVALGSTEFIVLRSKTLSPEYVYLMARSDEFRDQAIKSMTGATGRQRVQVACFDEFMIAHPDQATLECFVAQLQPVFRSIQNLAERNNVLRRTRDLLLPRLVSGQVDVSELEIAVEEPV